MNLNSEERLLVIKYLDSIKVVNVAAEDGKALTEFLKRIRDFEGVYQKGLFENRIYEDALAGIDIEIDEEAEYEEFIASLRPDQKVCERCDGRGGFEMMDHDGSWIDPMCNICRGTGIVPNYIFPAKSVILGGEIEVEDEDHYTASGKLLVKRVVLATLAVVLAYILLK